MSTTFTPVAHRTNTVEGYTLTLERARAGKAWRTVLTRRCTPGEDTHLYYTPKEAWEAYQTTATVLDQGETTTEETR
ncbi:hypothetical protein [Actinobaculum massiliense]|uniref:hypothetical protein n=1 Tax=Actinobaculum massiliense TaxID=202789 RepID=UPI00071AF4F5|nr:hypothetical protein [Actinobaculum massiliense]